MAKVLECYSYQDISNWDVSKVINMVRMFCGCKSFNQDLSDWDVSKVRFKAHVFLNCSIENLYMPMFKYI